MVEVATKLDIPAKMLFPRPDGMSMLGLGDIVVPGMVIGFALRFDLWRFYTRVSQIQVLEDSKNDKRRTRASSGVASLQGAKKTSGAKKPTYRPATGHWGARFWTGSSMIRKSSELKSLRGVMCPKPYFHATLIGYVVGMLCTLLVMQVYGHAQPALLYLVPGVLWALWGTALVRGEVGMLWAYSEDSGGENKQEDSKATEAGPKNKPNESTEKGAERRTSWWKWLLGPYKAQTEEEAKNKPQPNGSAGHHPVADQKSNPKRFPEPSWASGYLIYLSVSLPRTKSSSTAQLVTEAQDRDSSEHDDT